MTPCHSRATPVTYCYTVSTQRRTVNSVSHSHSSSSGALSPKCHTTSDTLTHRVIQVSHSHSSSSGALSPKCHTASDTLTHRVIQVSHSHSSDTVQPTSVCHSNDTPSPRAVPLALTVCHRNKACTIFSSDLSA